MGGGFSRFSMFNGKCYELDQPVSSFYIGTGISCLFSILSLFAALRSTGSKTMRQILIFLIVFSIIYSIYKKIEYVRSVTSDKEIECDKSKYIIDKGTYWDVLFA